MGHESKRFGIVALVFGAASACSAPAPKTDPVASTITSTTSVAPTNSRQIGQFTATFDRKTHTMSIKPIGTPVSLADDTLEPESQDSITVSQKGGGTCGSAGQPCNTVDLVSTNCVDTFATGGHTFQCDVEMRSYFNTRSLANVYAQITAASISGYDGIDSDTDSTYSPPLDNTHGLWSYQNGSTNGPFLSLNDGSNGGNGNGNNSATRTWEFNNTSDQNVVYTIAVWASKGFSSYLFGFANSSYVDACSGGTAVVAASKTNITVPFDFTIYNTNTTRVNIARNGQMTFGATAITNSNAPIALPSTSAPHPVLFPFWDDLAYGAAAPPINPTAAAGEMCYQTIGSAPSRQFVVEWRNMNFGNAPGKSPASSLDFEAFLYEGTGEIDTVYNEMLGTTGRETGTQATIGVQNESGTSTESDHDLSPLAGDYSSGNGNSYVPSP
jgi:hypothetical protein